MTVKSVHWHEGMSLWPQQLQLADRFQGHQLLQSHKWNCHYNWGLRALDLDMTLLANHQFVVRSLKARMRDGTLIAIPEDANMSALDLKPALDQHDSVTVYLGVPLLRMSKPNVSPRQTPGTEPPAPETADAAADPRYWVETQDCEDENTGEDPQPIHVRLPNVKLLLSTQSNTGYEILPLARVGKSGQQPLLDVHYIPALLACDAWKALHEGILQAVYDRLGRKIEALAAQVVTRGISFDTRNPGDGLLLGQLQALNEAYGLLHVLAFAEGIHPLWAYLELCRLAGQLAVFAKPPRPPVLPRYDHDDLGGCFFRVKQFLDSIELSEPTYKERPFVGEGLRMQVALEPAWLEPSWGMYVGVQSPLPADECIRLMTKQGQLDTKIGSSTHVDKIFEQGSAGLEFLPCPQPPRALPSAAGLQYFQVNRTSKPEEWQHVQQSLTLALRLNQSRIVGNIQGQKTVTVRTKGNTTTMQFTLFVVPQGD